ncbi:MAG TPA: hypothetical protein VK112_09420 [Fodinibius sp.]|nr:hypothetical protein [Fodinibius sp.]
MESFQRRSVKYLLLTVVVYAVLVATHLGEFWPFSIYPMFSKAGNPWTRAMVRDVSNTPDTLIWSTRPFDEVQGQPVALRQYGVDQIDFANFISKTTDWNHKRRRALRNMFGARAIGDQRFMAMKVTGRLAAGDSVEVKTIPLMLITRDTVYASPEMNLKQQ